MDWNPLFLTLYVYTMDFIMLARLTVLEPEVSVAGSVGSTLPLIPKRQVRVKLVPV